MQGENVQIENGRKENKEKKHCSLLLFGREKGKCIYFFFRLGWRKEKQKEKIYFC